MAVIHMKSECEHANKTRQREDKAQQLWDVASHNSQTTEQRGTCDKNNNGDIVH